MQYLGKTLLDVLDENRDSLTAADAGATNGVLAVGAFQLIDEV